MILDVEKILQNKMIEMVQLKRHDIQNRRKKINKRLSIYVSDLISGLLIFRILNIVYLELK